MKDYERQSNVGGSNGEWESLGAVSGGFNKEQAARVVNEKLKELGLEKPKSYKMESVKFFSEDGVSIDGTTWSDFYETAWSEGEEKDERYEQKVLDAIEDWNSAPQEERAAFLQTGIMPDSISGETVSLLTSARIINFAKPKGATPPPPPPPPPPRHDEVIIDTGNGGDKPTDEPEGDPSDGHTKPRGKKTPFWKRIFGPRKKRGVIEETPTPQPQQPEETPEKRPSDTLEKTPEEQPDDIPEDTPDGTDTDPTGGTPEIPHPEETENKNETEPEPPEMYEIIKDIKEEELPPEEREKLEEVSTKKRGGLRRALAAGALIAVVALAFLKPPVEITDKNHVSVETSSQEVVTTIDTVPETIEEVEVTPDEDPDLYQELATKKLLEDTELGGKMSVGEGTDFWESPDHEFGGADNHGVVDNESIRPAGEYAVERLVILDAKTGEYLGNFYSGNGDSGTLAELTEKVRAEYPDREISMHICFDDPATGWSGNIIGGDFPVTGVGNVTQEVVVPEHSEINTGIEEHSAIGEADNVSEDGTIEIIDSDGTSSRINIRHEDGTFYQPGETVIDSNGKTHTIRNIEVSENGKNMRIIWENVLWDAAMLATAGTGIYLATRRRGGEGASEGEQEMTPGGEQTTTPERRVEVRREMMELNAGQLINLVDIFTETAGDRAMDIATELAERAGTGIAEETPAGSSENETILDAMTAPEKTVAKALLAKRDEATLRHLSELLGIELEDYAERILNNNETEG